MEDGGQVDSECSLPWMQGSPQRGVAAVEQPGMNHEGKGAEPRGEREKLTLCNEREGAEAGSTL